MTTTCPNGHESTWSDWCSTCGERLDAGAEATTVAPAATTSPDPAPASAAAAATPPPTGGPTCDNCGVPRFEHDVFCESCGYDFASGSLPDDAMPDGAGTAPPAPLLHTKVSVDPDFFSASVGDVDLALPEPLPEQQIVPLPGIRILIGRQSTSRGIFPEIDVRALTDDPAVSSRHAMLERDPTNTWSLTDLGSTNGTFLSAAADEPIAPGVAVPIAPGTSIYLGAWTRLDIAETTP